MKNLKRLKGFIVMVLFASAFMQAQKVYPEWAKLVPVSDAELVVQYDLKWSCDEDARQNKSKDVMYLYAGRNAAVSYIEREMLDDVRLMANFNQDGKRGSNISNFLRSTIGQTFTNYPKGKTTVIKNLDAAGVFLYEEEEPATDWKLSNDTLTVAGYLCKKANGTLYGRDYTVWYAQDIPSQFGPWKLKGLPGLILKATSDDGDFDFTAVGIERRNEPIYFWERDYNKKSREQILKQERQLLMNPAEYLEDYGISFKVITFDDTTPKIGFINPIELD